MSYAPRTLRALACAVVCSLLGASLASAHARPAVLNRLVVDRGDPDHIVAQATWGMAVTRDGGASWRWTCAAVLGVDPRIEDPDVLLAYEGRVLASTYDGLFVSDPAGCEWDFAAAELSDRWVIDLARDPGDAERIYAVATDIGNRDQLYRSLDEGRSWTPHGPARDEVLMATVHVAPSRALRLYVSADIPGLPEARQTMVLRSDDGGEGWERLPFTELEASERIVRVRAVDPSEPDVVYAAVYASVGAALDPHRLVRSDDGGATFETVLEASQLGDVLVAEDGASVWVGSRAGGVYRSEDHGLTFARVHPDLPVTCLAFGDGELRACTEQARAGFALARSADGGRTWDPLLRLEEIDTLLECPTCSDVGVACPAWQPDVSFDLGFELDFDAGVELDPDGGVGLPRDAAVPFECGGPPPPSPSCGCRAPPAGPSAPWGFVLVLGLLVRFSACSGRLS